MNKKDLEAFAREAAKGIKTEKDLTDMRAMLTKVMVEAALSAELDDHLGYRKHEQSSSDNSRNGVTAKPCALKMASLSWIRHVTDKVILNRSW